MNSNTEINKSNEDTKDIQINEMKEEILPQDTMDKLIDIKSNVMDINYLEPLPQATLKEMENNILQDPWDGTNTSPVKDIVEEQPYKWVRRNQKNPKTEDLQENNETQETNQPLATGIDDLPLFADERNVLLHKQIRTKEKRLVELKTEITESNSRVDIMTEHLKNVKQELVHTQALYNAKKKEIESEQHMKVITEREIGRIQQEIRTLETQNQDIQQKLMTIQNFIVKGSETMDQFKIQMNWNQEEMEQWTIAAKQKEEDALTLERYRRADDSKIKDLNLNIQKLTQTLQQIEHQLSDEATETHAKQIELDKTAEEYKQYHTERQKLIQQWQETVETMKKRDQEIEYMSQKYAEIRQILQQKKDLLLEQKNRLKLQETENHDAQTRINTKERQQSKMQQDCQDTRKRLEEFKDQVELLKNQLSSAVVQLNNLRSYNQNKYTHLETMKQELEDARSRYKSTKLMLETCMHSTSDAETLAKEAEADLNRLENEQKRMDKEITIQKDVMFRKSQQLFELRQKEASLISDISGCKAASQNLSMKLRQLDQQTLRQQELVYNGEFQIQQMERKIARASGERSAEETKILQAQIQVLQMELDRVRNEFIILSTQCKKLQDEKRAQDRVKKVLSKQNHEIQIEIHELELSNEVIFNTLKQTLKEKEDLLVQHDIQSLEVKRLKDLLNMRADEVLSLENRDFQLKKSMEQQKKEIQMQKELQRMTNKHLEEARHKVQVELAERQARVLKLQAKFETLCKLSGYGTEDHDGEERSQAYYVIKAAQKREELQREGDELDDQIRIAEKEVKALKKTLEHLEDRNSNYRKSFHRAEEQNEQTQQLKTLEEQMKQSEDYLFKKKKELARIEMDIESESNQLREIETQKQFLVENGKQLETTYTQIQKDFVQEQMKFTRIHRKLYKSMKEYKKNKKTQGSLMQETLGLCKEEMIVEMYGLKEIKHLLLYTLGQLANEFPEISDFVSVNVKELGLHIPSAPPGRSATSKAIHSSSNYNPRPGSAKSVTSSEYSSRGSVSSSSSSFKSSSSRSSGTRTAATIKRVQIGF